jgi:hypothetical protein
LKDEPQTLPDIWHGVRNSKKGVKKGVARPKKKKKITETFWAILRRNREGIGWPILGQAIDGGIWEDGSVQSISARPGVGPCPKGEPRR